MDLLQQCQRWHENGDYDKIIEALEAIPAGERSPQQDSELARAYNNKAQPGDKALFSKAVALLKPHEALFGEDHLWNFRLGYAYYYMDLEPFALPYLEKALELLPSDEDTETLLKDCRRRVALPLFRENFRQRVQRAWEAFAALEEELRRGMDEDKSHQRGEDWIALCSQALEIAFSSPAFELGYNGQKYELILSAEGDKARLFPLCYFRQQAPEQVLEHWNILVGRQPMANMGLRAGDWDLSGDEVQVWVEQQGESTVGLSLYCEKLQPLLRQEEGRAWWLLSTLTDQVLGEVAALALIRDFNVLTAPQPGESCTLSQLPQRLKELGLPLSNDAESYLANSYTAYRLQPVEDPQEDWRLDCYAGSTRLPVLINEYLAGRSDSVAAYYQDGIAAGFFCYPLDGFDGEERGKDILDFRDSLEAALSQQAGEAVTFLGGASGLFCGYLDFIAWDLPAVLDAATAFFEESPVDWANFHVFYRDAPTVPLYEREED